MKGGSRRGPGAHAASAGAAAGHLSSLEELQGATDTDTVTLQCTDMGVEMAKLLDALHHVQLSRPRPSRGRLGARPRFLEGTGRSGRRYSPGISMG